MQLRTTLVSVLLLHAGLAPASDLEVVIQTGHLGEVLDLAYSPDGCYLATAGSDNQVALWDNTTGQLIKTFRGGHSPHTSVSFAAEGRLLTIGQESGPVTQWEVLTGKRHSVFETEQGGSVSTNASGDIVVAVGGGARTPRPLVTVWRRGLRPQQLQWARATQKEAPAIPERHHSLEHRPNVVTVNAAGTYFATAGNEGRTAVWKVGRNVPERFIDLKSIQGEQLQGDPKGQDTPHILAEFSPGGDYIGGAIGHVAYLWPVTPGANQITLDRHVGAVSAIAFSDDEKYVAVGLNAGRVHVYEFPGGRQVAEFDAHEGGVRSLAFRPVAGGCGTRGKRVDTSFENRVLATSGADNKARIWSMRNNTLLQVLAPKAQPLNDVRFSPDGRYLAMASSASPHGSVKLWDLTTGFDVTAFSGHEGGVNALAFSPQGDIIATAGVDNVTIAWDLRSLTPITTIGKKREKSTVGDIVSAIVGIAILSNETAAGIIGNSSISASLYTSKHSTNKGAQAVAFSNDGRYLVTGGLGKTRLWDRHTDSLIEDRFAKKDASELIFTADDRTILRSRQAAHTLDLVSGEKIKKVAGKMTRKRTVVTVDLHPTEQKFAVAYELGRVDIVHLNDGERWQHHEGAVRARSLRFNRDGSLLAAGNDAGEVLIFRIDDRMTHIQTLKAHADSVLALDFNHDGTMLASAGIDGTVRVWDTGSWSELLTFVSIGTEDFVVLAPDNYYAASTNGLIGVAFRRGNELFPFSQFDLQYNRPDLVFARLGTVSDDLLRGLQEAHRKRLKRRNIDDVELPDLDRLPTVRITNMGKRARSDEKALTFTVVAADGPAASTGIESINVWVNDVPLYGSRGHALAGRPATARHNVTVELSAGRNRIQVSATNSRGMESTRVTMVANYEPPTRIKPDLYLIAIGVSEYADKTWNLRYAAKDAIDLSDRLQSQGRFGQIHSWRLLNEEATRDRILAIEPALRNTRVDDEVVIFVAGHGILDENLDYYFGTHDIDFRDPAERGLSDEQLESLLDGIPARRKMLLMDTCFSGEVDPDAAMEQAQANTPDGVRAYHRGVQVVPSTPDQARVDSFYLMQKLFANLGESSGAVILSASGGHEFAFEGQDQNPNGVFTHSIIEAISGVPEKDYIRLSQLRQFVVTRVRELTSGLQTPTVRRVNLEFDYPFFSIDEPQLSDIPEIDTFDFGRLFIQAAEQSVLTED